MCALCNLTKVYAAYNCLNTIVMLDYGNSIVAYGKESLKIRINFYLFQVNIMEISFRVKPRDEF